MSKVTRRSVVRSIAYLSAASATVVATPRWARAAEFQLKFGNNLPVSHPLNVRAQEAADRISKNTNGRVQLSIFPNNQLGGDTDMLAQLRSGALSFFTPSPLVISTLVPAAMISSLGFAFQGYADVWKAMDGSVGSYVRAAIEKANLYAFEKIWDNGFRQITTSGQSIKNARDVEGLKIRVPVSPISVSTFKALSAAPASIQFSEVYSSLQTKIVDAQENPLPLIQLAKFYEVQRSCALSKHMWDAYWFVASGRVWKAIPADVQKVIASAINDAGMQQREDIKALNATVQSDLESKGLAFNEVDIDSFRSKLRQSGFYNEWKVKFGSEAWALLEQQVGKLG